MQTILFECRHYRAPIKKGRLLEFKGVVDDIAGYEGSLSVDNPSGTMVTSSRYQVGARRVAETYGLTIAELRPPTPDDVAGRVLEVRVTMKGRVPHVDNIHLEPAEPIDPDGASEISGVSDEFELAYPDGERPASSRTSAQGN